MVSKILPVIHFLIPDNAECVFNGQIYDVYQWPQTMFDGTTKTFEMLKRPDTLQIVVACDGKILLVDDEQPGSEVQRHFPGGRHEAGEDWLVGAARELQEETGVVCKDLRLVNVQQPVTKIEWFTPIFLGTNVAAEGEPNPDIGGEKITALWEDFDVVRNQVMSGQEQMMQYLIPFFNQVKTYEQLIALPQFEGITVERP